MTTPFTYDPARLTTQYSSFHQRLAWVHPSSPSVAALGDPTVFMGWTKNAAVQQCAQANAAMTFYHCGLCGAYHRMTYYGDCQNVVERWVTMPVDGRLVENERRA